MFALADIADYILILGTFADYHTFVDFDARGDEQPASVLSVEQTVCGAHAGLVNNYRAAFAGDYLAFVGLVAVEQLVHDTVAVCVGEELGAVADESSRRNAELKMSCAAVTRAHVDKLALAGAELLYNCADILLGNFDYEQLHRLAGLAVYLFENDLRARNLELVALTAHGLNEN